MDFKTISLAEIKNTSISSYCIHIANHDWCPILPSDESSLTFFTNQPLATAVASATVSNPFADFGPNTRWLLRKCHVNCASIDICKKVSLAEANEDNIRAHAYLTNFNTLFGVSQNKKIALLIRTRKKTLKNTVKKPKSKKEVPESESEEEEEVNNNSDDEESIKQQPQSDSEEEDEIKSKSESSDTDDKIDEEEIIDDDASIVSKDSESESESD
jgi:hypothetical protein